MGAKGIPEDTPPTLVRPAIHRIHIEALLPRGDMAVLGPWKGMTFIGPDHSRAPDLGRCLHDLPQLARLGKGAARTMITAVGVGAVALAIAATITAAAVEAEATAVTGAAINVGLQGGRWEGKFPKSSFPLNH
jgi:hypothetical protein